MKKLFGQSEAVTDSDESPVTASELMAEGLQHGQNGQWDAAAACFDRAAKTKPDLADAHHNLGVAFLSLDRPQDAVDAAKAAVALDGSNISYLINLGNAAARANELETAETALRNALKHAPEDHRIIGNLGIILLRQEKWADAVEFLSLATSGATPIQPLKIPLANALRQKELHDDALKVIDDYLDIEPGSTDALTERFHILFELKRWDDAITIGERLRAHQPTLKEVVFKTSEAYTEARNFDKATQVLSEYTQLAPLDAQGHLQLGIHHHKFADFTQAQLAYETVLRLSPDNAMALCNLGRLNLELRQYKDAERFLRRARKQEPQLAEAIANLSDALMASGKLAEGFDLQSDPRASKFRSALFEADPKLKPANFALTGKRILIRREQGLGDEIRLSTCFPDVIDDTEGCIIQCDKRMANIFGASFPDAEIHPVEPIEAPTDVPDESTYDAAFLAGDLPTRYRRNIGDFPSRKSLLVADSEKRELWRDRLAAIGPTMKVGICWRSGFIDWQRMRTAKYTHLDEWVDVFSVPNTSFINLFYGECSHEFQTLEEQFGFQVHQWTDLDLLDDLDSVFALIAELDLVITVQTAVWNMAGAVGTETWALLNPIRLLGTDYVPWFSSVKPILHSLDEPNEVILQRVARQLEQRVSSSVTDR